MKVVFSTLIEEVTYRHLHFHEGTEATVENLLCLIEELSELLELYNLEDHTRCKLQIELQQAFDSDKTIAVMSYRVSRIVK